MGNSKYTFGIKLTLIVVFGSIIINTFFWFKVGIYNSVRQISIIQNQKSHIKFNKFFIEEYYRNSVYLAKLINNSKFKKEITTYKVKKILKNNNSIFFVIIPKYYKLEEKTKSFLKRLPCPSVVLNAKTISLDKPLYFFMDKNYHQSMLFKPYNSNETLIDNYFNIILQRISNDSLHF